MVPNAGHALPLGEGPAKLGRGVRWLAWGTLAYVILVVLWGAFVRATGSGAGCGDHWPLCNGVAVPREPGIQTIIEFTHRLTSGLAGIFSLALLAAAFIGTPKKHPIRAAAVAQFIFMILEGAVGAGLVLFQLVADNQAMARAYAMCAHLVNTFLLLWALALTAHYASGGKKPKYSGQGAVFGTFAASVAGLLILGMSGAVAALGDTLFPAQSLSHALEQDFSPTAHLFLRLRLFHPLIAIVTGLLVVGAAWTASSLRPSRTQRRWAITLSALFGVQLLAGLVNVVLLAPVWMQLVHLLLADAVWLAVIFAGASALSAPAPELASGSADASPVVAAP